MEAGRGGHIVCVCVGGCHLSNLVRTSWEFQTFLSQRTLLQSEVKVLLAGKFSQVQISLIGLLTNLTRVSESFEPGHRQRTAY